MKQDNNGLDEMQKAKRDKIGNQSFILMPYLLLLESGLYSFGVRWLAYPANNGRQYFASEGYRNLQPDHCVGQKSLGTGGSQGHRYLAMNSSALLI